MSWTPCADTNLHGAFPISAGPRMRNSSIEGTREQHIKCINLLSQHQLSTWLLTLTNFSSRHSQVLFRLDTHPVLHSALRETRNQGTNPTLIIKYENPAFDFKYLWALYYVFLQTDGQEYQFCEQNGMMRPRLWKLYHRHAHP